MSELLILKMKSDIVTILFIDKWIPLIQGFEEFY